jgi:hypothetical protein
VGQEARGMGGLSLAREGTRMGEGEKRGMTVPFQRCGGGGGRWPRGGDGMRTAWGTGAAVRRHAAASTGLEPVCMGRWHMVARGRGAQGADRRAPATVWRGG